MQVSKPVKITAIVVSAAVVGGIAYYFIYGRRDKFRDTNWSNGSLYGAAANGYVGLVVPKAIADKYKSGDTVNIKLDNNSFNPSYEGDATVIGVYPNQTEGYKNDYLIVVNKSFGASTINESGSIVKKAA